MDIQKSEAILDAAGHAIKAGEVKLSGRDWRKMAGILLSALVIILSLCGTAIWVVAKTQYQSFKTADAQNTAEIQSVRKASEARSRDQDNRIKVLENAITRIDTNMDWIKGYVQAQEAARAQQAQQKDVKGN